MPHVSTPSLRARWSPSTRRGRLLPQPAPRQCLIHPSSLSSRPRGRVPPPGSPIPRASVTPGVTTATGSSDTAEPAAHSPAPGTPQVC